MVREWSVGRAKDSCVSKAATRMGMLVDEANTRRRSGSRVDWGTAVGIRSGLVKIENVLFDSDNGSGRMQGRSLMM